MGGYQNIRTENYNTNTGIGSGNASQYQYATNPSGGSPISVVNPALSGDNVGDEFVSDALKELNVKKSNTSDIILNQRLALHNEIVKESGNANLSNEEKKEKFAPFIDLENIRKTLADKCNKTGISFSELMIKMTAITGKTPREFYSLKPEIQGMLLNFVIESIDRVVKKNLPDVNIMEAVITDCAMMYEFVFSDNGEVVDIANLTPEEIRIRRKNCDEKFNKLRAEREAEFSKMSPEEREVAKKQLMEELAAKRKHIFETLSKKVSFESAIELLLMVSVMDLGDEAKALMESYPIEIREKIANTLQNFDSFKEYIELAKGRGEALDDEKAQFAIEQYHKIFGTYKTKENLEAYQEEFIKARTNGELPEEVLKPTSMGIGEAAYANINMTSEEKHVFIQRWVADNNGFLTDADMAKVENTAKEYIKDLLNKNPEIREKFSQVEKSIKEFVEKTLNREFKPQIKNQQEANKKNKDNKVSVQLVERKVPNFFFPKSFMQNPQFREIKQTVVDFAKLYIARTTEKFENTAIEKTDEQFVNALLKGIITEKEAIKNLNNSEHKFILLCVKNDKLAEVYEDRILQYIKNEKDNDKLEEIAVHAPRNILEKMIKIMRGDKQELAEELIKYNQVDYNAKVMLENIVYNEEVA